MPRAKVTKKVPATAIDENGAIDRSEVPAVNTEVTGNGAPGNRRGRTQRPLVGNVVEDQETAQVKSSGGRKKAAPKEKKALVEKKEQAKKKLEPKVVPPKEKSIKLVKPTSSRKRPVRSEDIVLPTKNIKKDVKDSEKIVPEKLESKTASNVKTQKIATPRKRPVRGKEVTVPFKKLKQESTSGELNNDNEVAPGNLETQAASKKSPGKVKILGNIEKKEEITAEKAIKRGRKPIAKKTKDIESSIPEEGVSEGRKEKAKDQKPVNANKNSTEKATRVKTAAPKNESIINGDTKETKASKIKTPVNPHDTVYNRNDFTLQTGNKDEGKRFNLKISSWNVAGLRSWLKKDGLKFLEYEEPDIFCMQEIKCTVDQLPEDATKIPGYHPYWLCKPGGYAGVAIYSKIMPINVEYGIGNSKFDENGRIITAEYEKFYLINVYVPNSGRKLVNLDARMEWESLFQAHVQRFNVIKPVIICGDMNVSHLDIDLANPKANTRNAGFTKEERDKMSELLNLGFIDTFRHLYPERKGAYTYWTYLSKARARNVGWRLDYFIVSERFADRIVDNCIRNQCLGSDHCPITLFVKN